MKKFTLPDFEKNHSKKQSRWMGWLALTLLLLIGKTTSAQVNAYLFEQSNGAYQSIVTDGVVVPNSTATATTTYDTNAWTVVLPFSFTFNGVAHSEIFVNSNGGATFGTTNSGAILISSTAVYAGAIAAMNRDLWGVFITSGVTTLGSTTITNVGSFSGIAVGKALRSGTGIPVGATITAFNETAGTITMSAVATSSNAIANIGWGSGSVFTKVEGVTPNRIFTIQWEGYNDFSTTATGSNYLSFQLKLTETLNTVQTVYGDFFSVSTTSRTNQIGLRGATNTDFRNRSGAVGNSWNSTFQGTVNTATVSRDNLNNPASGLTFTWTPSTCLPPTDLTVTNLTVNSATLAWTSAGTAFDLQWGPENFVLGSGTIVSEVIAPYVLSGLNPSTLYQFYIRQNCGIAGGFSAWAGPFNFVTVCEAQTAFFQNFDTSAIGATVPLPTCWLRAGNGTVNVTSGSLTPNSAPNRLFMSANATAATPTLAVAMMPVVSNLQAATHRLKFKAYASVAGRTIEVGYFANIADLSTFVAIQVITLPGTNPASALEFSISPTGIPAGVDQLAFRNNAPLASTLAYIDDVAWEPIPACPDITVISQPNFNSTSSTISWIAGGTEQVWEYVFGADSVTDPTTLVPVTVSTNPTIALTGLTPATSYNIWIRSNCGNGALGNWPQAPFTFSTSCAPVVVFTENFDSYTATGTANPLPICWSRFGTTGSSFIATSTLVPMTPPNRLTLTASATGSTNAYAVMPPVSNLQAETHRLKFKAFSTSADKSLEIGYFEMSGDATSFVVLEAFVMPSTAASTATEFIYIPEFIPAGIESIAFRVNGGAFSGTTSIQIDDVEWEVIPSCADITDIELSNILTTTLDVFWTTMGVESAWQYVFAVSTVTDPTTLTPTTVNNFPFLALTGLLPNTSYNLWIRSNCGPGAFGQWSSPQTFTTACALVTNFSEDFDTSATGAANPLPTCWLRAGNGTTTVNTGGVFPGTPPNRLYMFANGVATTTTIAIAIMPPVSNLAAGTHRLKFTAYATSVNKSVEIGYYGDAANLDSFVLLQAIPLPSTAASTAAVLTYIPTGVPDGITNLAFRNLGLPTSTALYIDNVVWEAIPLCPDISVINIAQPTATSVSFSWTLGGSETAWDYVYDVNTVTDPTTLTPITVNNVPNASITGLLPNTTYNLWVRSNCGPTALGTWSTVRSFITNCAPAATFTENFDTSLTGAANPLPTCWLRAGNGTTTVNTGGVAPGSAPNRLFLSANGTATTPTVAIAIMPPVSNLEAGTHRLKFKAYASSLNRSIEIGYYTDIIDLNTYVPLQSIALPGTAASTALEFSFIPVGVPAGVTFIAFRNNAPLGSTLIYIDDVVWELQPLCPDVNIPTFTGATDTTADISWTAGGSETTWEYVIGSSTDTDPLTLTPVEVTGTPQVTITGLLFSTNYKVWIRSKCGTNLGLFSAPVAFLTACAPIVTLPWTEGFEGIATVGTNAFPPCWIEQNGDWASSLTGTYNTARTGTKYIRNSDIATNEFMWTPGFTLTAGTSYDYSFFMQGDGALGWDISIFYNTFQNSVNATQLGTTVNPSGTGTVAIQPYSKVTNTFVPSTTGTYYFAIRVNQPSSLAVWFVAFDDFALELTPSCAPPAVLPAATVTSSTATIAWIAPLTAPVNGYEYFVTTDAALMPSAATIATGSVAAGITTLDLTGLAVASQTSVFIRSLCSTTETSLWSNAISITTLCAVFDAPFLQDFSTYLPNCWTTADAGTVATGPTSTATGIWTSDGFLNVGAAGAVKVNLFFENRIGWLITPQMNTTVGTEYTFSFNYGATIWNQTTPAVMGSDDFVKVAMSTNNGITWTEIHNFTTASNISNSSQEYNYGFVAAASEVKFALIASDGTVNDLEDYDFFVDNLSFEAVLSNTDFTKNSFTAYPNPVKGNLTIRCNENITHVSVYNLLGQRLFAKNVNATEGEVDMSNLAPGNYIVKVNSGEKSHTVKVYKE